MEITRHQLTQLLTHAAELGAKKAICEYGHLKPYLNKSQAFKKYGRANVERWLKEGLITPIKDGSDSAAWRLLRLELEAVAMASNRTTYLRTSER